MIVILTSIICAVAYRIDWTMKQVILLLMAVLLWCCAVSRHIRDVLFVARDNFSLIGFENAQTFDSDLQVEVLGTKKNLYLI